MFTPQQSKTLLLRAAVVMLTLDMVARQQRSYHVVALAVVRRCFGSVFLCVFRCLVSAGAGWCQNCQQNPKPPRYLPYRVLESLGPPIVRTWELREKAT